MRIAVLGMGRMGKALAGRLLEGGHEVVVWNRSKGKTGDLVAAGAKEADEVAQAAAGADVVISILANDDAVRAVALGDGGVRSAIGADAVYANASTVSPALSEQLEEAFPAFVAMPILGAPGAVAEGKAVYLAGGRAAAVERLQPVLAALATTVRRYDAAPLASAAKLASNLLLLCEVVALAEAFAVGRAGGLSDDQLRELLGESPLVSALKNRFEGILTGEHDSWWTTVLGAKDARLAVEVARAAGIDTPEIDVAARRYEEAAERGLADADIAAVTLLYRR